MNPSKIPWCDYSIAGAWLGCTPRSEGCENCYAAAMDRRFRGGVEIREFPRVESEASHA